MLPDGESCGDSFQVLAVLNQELDKTHRNGSKGVHLLKVEKNYATLGEIRLGEQTHRGPEDKGKVSSVSRIPRLASPLCKLSCQKLT